VESGAAQTTQIYMHPREAVRRLAAVGLVHGLDEAALNALRDECWDGSEEQLEEAGLLAILSFYYETVARGAQDGWVWHADEFWHDTDDAVAEVAATLKMDPPLFKQASSKERVSTTHKIRENVLAIELERDDGVRKSIEARNLTDIVECFNTELASRGDPRRLIRLETGGEWQMFVATDLKTARKLVAEGALPVADLESLSG
jgi:hypothetical protein